MTRIREFLRIILPFLFALTVAGTPAAHSGDFDFSFIFSFVVSLHPTYAEDDVVVDDAFVGIWELSDGQEYVIEEGGEKSYSISWAEGDGAVGHFFRIGGQLFLDLTADRDAMNLKMERGTQAWS